MPSFSTLRDDFSNNSIDSAWSSNVAGGAAVQETSGQARITLPSSTAGAHQGYYRSTGNYDLTSDSFYINIGTMVATGVAATAFFDLFLDELNALRWTQTSNTIKAQTIVAGVVTDRFSATWSSTNHKYLRIRESGGNVLFDSSSNGTSWTNRASVAAPFAVTALFVQFGASCGNVASPGSLRLDDVNLILPALSTTWRYTEAERPYIPRVGSVTISATSGQGYLATAEELDASGNLVSPRYFSGPIGSTSGGYLQLTEYSAQADAQAMAVNLPADGRWDLPGYVSASVVRLYHRSITGSSYRVDEYYPRRLVQSDDIEAESITALNIAANTITADKITTLTLTGKNIQTATSGARVVLSGDAAGGLIGYGASDTYDTVAGTGTYQVLWSKNDGKLYAGAGNVVLDSAGITYNSQFNVYSGQGFRITRPSDLSYIGGLTGFQTSVSLDSNVRIESRSSDQDAYLILAPSVGIDTNTARIQFQMLSGLFAPTLLDMQTTGAVSNIELGTAIGTNTINLIGNTTVSGSISATVTDSVTTAGTVVATIGHNSTGTPGANFGTALRFQSETSTTPDTDVAQITARWSTATHASRASQMLFLTSDSVGQRTNLILGANGSAPTVGFFGSTGASKPTVTGSRGGNAALASLLTALANLGLVTDSSS